MKSIESRYHTHIKNMATPAADVLNAAAQDELDKRGADVIDRLHRSLDFQYKVDSGKPMATPKYPHHDLGKFLRNAAAALVVTGFLAIVALLQENDNQHQLHPITPYQSGQLK